MYYIIDRDCLLIMLELAYDRSSKLLEIPKLFNSCNQHSWFIHDDVIKWKHFPLNWPFVRGIHRSPVNSLHKGLWRGTLMLSLICVWINDWVNNREAGDLRRNRAHYDVIVMSIHMSDVWMMTSILPIHNWSVSPTDCVQTISNHCNNIWRHRFKSTLDQTMAYCRHNSIQNRLVINTIPRCHLSEC